MVTSRLDGHLSSIGLSRALAGTKGVMLVQDFEVRVVDEATGELLRALTIDRSKKFQARGVARGRKPNLGPHRGFAPLRMC